LTVLQTILAGVFGTALMSLLMTVIQGSGRANADMIRALGSLITRSRERALGPGLLIHFTSGALFAFPYAIILSGLRVPSIFGLLGVGALLGFVHGFVMSFLLVAVVSEKHPLEMYREAGVSVAVAHIAGHVVYGLGVGLIVGLLGIDFGFRL
jgi:hypothetical protein